MEAKITEATAHIFLCFHLIFPHFMFTGTCDPTTVGECLKPTEEALKHCRGRLACAKATVAEKCKPCVCDATMKFAPLAGGKEQCETAIHEQL